MAEDTSLLGFLNDVVLKMIETEFEHERDSLQTGLMLTHFTTEDKRRNH